MFKRFLYVCVLSLGAISCSEDSPSFSILSDTDTFVQSNSSFNNKLDILWVIDNSGSMAPYQTNLSNNFNAFINDFMMLGYDFRMAVITTDAWHAKYYGVYNWKAAFKTDSGHAILTPSTPNLANAFSDNVLQGTGGYGDERAFQSIEVALDHSSNAPHDFPRADAFLAIIIVSDEDDFSHNGTSYLLGEYSNPALYSIGYYTNYLDNLTSSTTTIKRYNVSTISVLDNACLTDPSTHVDAIIGYRHMDLATAANGILGSICDTNFSTSLNEIQQTIGELSTQFCLSREPIPETIKVSVNSVSIPEDNTNGWSYNSTANCIRFHGAALPSEGSAISVTFDPVGLEL